MTRDHKPRFALQTGAHPALVALARLLAREAAREIVRSPPPTGAASISNEEAESHDASNMSPLPTRKSADCGR